MHGDASKDVNHINCPSCGSYVIDGTFHCRIPNGQLSKREQEFVQYDMADYIKEEKPEIVGSPDTDPKAYQYYAQRKRQRQNLQSGPLQP
jgi:hypothetical protein